MTKKQILVGILSSIMLLGCSPKSPSTAMAPAPFNLQVTGYENGGRMPAKFATRGGGGQNISIGLNWSAAEGAKSYALLFDDKHPVAHNWVHWLVVDIPAGVTEIPEGASRTAQMPAGSRELVTSWDRTGYDGPQPPPGSGDHEYVATLFALDVEKLNVPEDISREAFLKAAKKNTFAQASYSGWFERK